MRGTEVRRMRSSPRKGGVAGVEETQTTEALRHAG